MNRAFVASLLVALCSACGGSSTTDNPDAGPSDAASPSGDAAVANQGMATLTGTIGGDTLIVRSSISANYVDAQQDPPQPDILILVTDVAGTCASIAANPYADYKGAHTVALALSSYDGGGVPQALTAGSYPITDAMSGNVAAAEYKKNDQACMPTDVPATAGTITLTTIGAAGIQGTFDLTFGTAEHVSGTFDTSDCKAIGDAQMTAGNGDDTQPETCT